MATRPAHVTNTCVCVCVYVCMYVCMYVSKYHLASLFSDHQQTWCSAAMAAAACTEGPRGLRGLREACPTPAPPCGALHRGNPGPAGAWLEGSGGSQEERPSSLLRACFGGAAPAVMGWVCGPVSRHALCCFRLCIGALHAGADRDREAGNYKVKNTMESYLCRRCRCCRRCRHCRCWNP